VIFPFDNRGGCATGIALVNPADWRQSVIARMRDYEGNLIELTGFDMQPGEHMSFSVATRFPKTANQIGTIEFKIDSNTVGGVLTGLGLRFGPHGSFTSIEPLMTR
jgi:hypothetical protein